MRCYLMKNDHIAAVEILAPGPDESLIQEARTHFERREKEEKFDRFEVWDGRRYLYAWPGETEHSAER